MPAAYGATWYSPNVTSSPSGSGVTFAKLSESGAVPSLNDSSGVVSTTCGSLRRTYVLIARSAAFLSPWFRKSGSVSRRPVARSNTYDVNAV
jgi:hypothetical protein